MSKNLFADFDFELLESPDFKEDSVREVLVMHLLHALGYENSGSNRIIRSKGLSNPYVKMGSKRLQIRMIPDYLFEVEGRFVWVLDAKSPSEQILNQEHVEQIYSYSIHPDVRVNYYALCNGREFILFQIGQREAVLHFHLSEIAQHWNEITKLLSPNSFKNTDSTPFKDAVPFLTNFDYMAAKPPREIKDTLKQSAKRHYGVHGYFTKQVWNVVQEYIKAFTQPGDVVLDPYGGSGVTAIEALILGRKGVHIDINPLSIFLVESLLAPIDFNLFAEAYINIKTQFEKHAPRSTKEIQDALKKHPYPKGVVLPHNSDVNTVEELFSLCPKISWSIQIWSNGVVPFGKQFVWM